MAIDFTLTDAQKDLQRTAREFAQEVLKPVVGAIGVSGGAVEQDHAVAESGAKAL